MNEDVKKAWVEALRGSDYSQAGGRLRRDTGFCCLGVLTDLYSKAQGVPWTEGTYPGGMKYFMFDTCTGSLPGAVSDWAGLDSADPTPKGCGDRLSILNDTYQWDFKKIADAIEQGL